MNKSSLQSAGSSSTGYVRKPRTNTRQEMKYLLENVPRELMAKAKTKARRHRIPMKWVLIKLLEQWVNGDRTVNG